MIGCQIKEYFFLFLESGEVEILRTKSKVSGKVVNFIPEALGDLELLVDNDKCKKQEKRMVVEQTKNCKGVTQARIYMTSPDYYPLATQGSLDISESDFSLLITTTAQMGLHERGVYETLSGYRMRLK